MLVGVLAAANEMMVVLAAVASAAASADDEVEDSVDVSSEVVGVVKVSIADVVDEEVELM